MASLFENAAPARVLSQSLEGEASCFRGIKSNVFSSFFMNNIFCFEISKSPHSDLIVDLLYNLANCLFDKASASS